MSSSSEPVARRRQSVSVSSALALAFIVETGLGRVADASVIYAYDDLCLVTSDCGPVGVLGVTVTAMTGSLELDIPASPDGGQTWGLTDVLAYSFTLGDFTIDDSNSALSSSGATPFHTQSLFNGRPFSGGDGFLIATYAPDNDVFLNISQGGINLVQDNEPGCSFNQCQTLGSVVDTDWSRLTAAPAPPALHLLPAALTMLWCARRRRAV